MGGRKGEEGIDVPTVGHICSRSLIPGCKDLIRRSRAHGIGFIEIVEECVMEPDPSICVGA